MSAPAAPAGPGSLPALVDHLARCRAALEALEADLDRIAAWGAELADRLGRRRARLLVAGNGGSAALAQHLSAELVGRYRRDRPAYDALALHADSSTVTAVVNDFGPDALFARQVEGCGRPGDVLLLVSTSGRSPNLLAAAAAARRRDMQTWALTGPSPNPLAAACGDAVAVDAPPPTVQEVQQVVVHLLCEVFDRAVGAYGPDFAPGRG